MAQKILLENMQSKNQVNVLGKILEAQYRIGDNFLLLITEGNPFEEALYIYFFNSCLQIKDSLEISAIYAGGILENISVDDSDTIYFSFLEKDQKWVLQILSSPEYIIWDNKYPVKRRLPIFRRS